MAGFDRWTLNERRKQTEDGPTRVEPDLDGLTPAHGGAPVGATLTVLHGAGPRQMYYVDASGGIIGRGDDVDFRLTNSTVSREHARFQFTDHAIFLEDLGSTNGTFVDETAVHGSIELPGSCRIRLGQYTVLQFVSVDEDGAVAYQRLQRAMFIDTLTGAGNRRYLNRRLEEELSYGLRHEEPVGVLLADLDHFKLVNDTWGHPVGDKVLAEVSAIMEDKVRIEDSVYRYGGEEFCILVRGIEEEGLLTMAERIREAVERLVVAVDGDEVRITVSIGIAIVVPESEDDPATINEATIEGEDVEKHRVITLADQALYRAKDNGRNQVVAFSMFA